MDPLKCTDRAPRRQLMWVEVPKFRCWLIADQRHAGGNPTRRQRGHEPSFGRSRESAMATIGAALRPRAMFPGGASRGDERRQ